MDTTAERIIVPVDCNAIKPFLMLGDEQRTIVSCQRPPSQHIGMDADCDCCDCTAHVGPGWSSLRWNRDTPGALSSTTIDG